MARNQRYMQQVPALGTQLECGMIHSLTSLRFFCALYVFLFHVRFVQELPPGLSNLVDNGFTGMTFFFILSGFVLAISHWDRPIAYGSFVSARVARLYPAFAVAFILSYAAYNTGAPSDAHALNLIANVTLMQAWFPGMYELGLNRGSWSISVELFFYLLFPFVCLAIQHRLRDAKIAVQWLVGLWLASFLPGLVQHVAPQPGGMWLYYAFPPFRLAEFLIGIVLAVIWKRELIEPRLSLLCLSGFAFVASCFAGLTTNNLTILNATAVPFILAIIHYSAEKRPGWLEWKPLVYLGEVSYGIYIYGFVTIPMLMWPMLHRGFDHMAVLIAGLLCTSGLAVISYHVLEQPTRALVRNHTSRISRVPAE